MDARLEIIEENELTDPVARLQFNLLRGGVQNVGGIPGVRFRCPPGTRLRIGNKDLAKLIGGILAVKRAIVPDFKCDVGKVSVVQPIVFHDAQARQLFVNEDLCGGLTGQHIGGVNGIIQLPADGTGQLQDFIGTRFYRRENGGACGIGGLGIDLTTLNMLDLHDGAGQVLTGIRLLFYPQ